jgi:hypothetical protein
MLVRRRILPIGVRWRSGLSNKCVATAGVSVRIVRNFGILKGTLSRPTRSDQCMTGPRDVSLIATAIGSHWYR